MYFVAEMIELTTDEEDYYSFGTLTMMTGDSTHVVFGVQACSNAHIALSEVSYCIAVFKGAVSVVHTFFTFIRLKTNI